MSQEIRVRFAPSPTGPLHIGGVRTAIFNWLFAKKYNGKFLLRIEDTDIIRSKEEYTQMIFDQLVWLGLEWNEEVVFQSKNLNNHIDNIHKLIREKKAYYCYCSEEKLENMRMESDKKGIPFKYPRTCLNLSEEQKMTFKLENIPKVVRFFVPEGETEHNDLIHGKIKVNNSEIDDFILLRANNTPTYHIAVVSDDYNMKITHIIRGDDHLSNTPKQILLYKALGFEIPEFGHLPLIFGTNKKKLSKRYSAVSLKEYIDMGILPDALFNFLALLGWSPGNDREFFSKSELIENFSLDGISKSNAVFDVKKLEWMNGKYISSKKSDELLPSTLPFFIKNKIIEEKNSYEKKSYLLNVIEILKSRVKTLNEFAEFGYYFIKDPSHYDESAEDKYWKEDAKLRLMELFDAFEKLDDFNVNSTEKSLRDLASSKNLSASKYIHPARLALTGFGVSPGLFEVMELLGKETVLRRLQTAIKYLEQRL
jgi:glutamyl-tRNA synthetase